MGYLRCEWVMLLPLPHIVGLLFQDSSARVASNLPYPSLLGVAPTPPWQASIPMIVGFITKILKKEEKSYVYPFPNHTIHHNNNLY